jgi:segregation and condensation protein B
MTEVGKLVSILFYSGDIVDEAELCRNFGINQSTLEKIKDDANKNLEKVGLFIISSEGKYQLTALSNYTETIEEFYEASPQPLSQASLEVLSIIAYKQPITRAEIDEIRGVSSDQSIKNLLNKDLIKKSSQSETAKYTTTTEFLKIAGIKHLKELHNNA